jgi:signal transduction histidine kinase
MTTRWNHITNGIGFRVVVPTLLVAFMGGWLGYLFVSSSMNGLIGDYVRGTIREKAASVLSICDHNFTELLRSGDSVAEKTIRIRKGLTLGMLEEFMSRSDVQLIVTENGRHILKPDTFSAAVIAQLDACNDSCGSFPGADHGPFYFEKIYFDPWQWEISLLLDSDLFDPLFQKTHIAYMFIGVIAFSCTLILLYTLSKTIYAPLDRIIAPLKKGKKPDYEGITEFAYLSDSLRNALEQAEQRTAELKEAYDVLEKNKEQLTTAQKIARLGYWEWDMVSNRATWSDEVFRIYGQDLETFTPSYECVVNSMQRADRDIFLKAIEAAISNHQPLDMDYTITLPDGIERILHTRGKVFYNAEGKPVRMVGTVQDITRQKEVELALKKMQEDLEFEVKKRTTDLNKAYFRLKKEVEERERTEQAWREMEVRAFSQAKLASLGEVATGMAHEIYQPLSYIKVIYQSLLRDIEEGELDLQEVADDSLEALRQVGRIAVIIEHLRTFGRSDAQIYSPCSPSAIVENALILMGEKMRLANIKLVREMEDDLPPILANNVQMEQVFINLFQNALDALQENGGGRVVLSMQRRGNDIVIRFADDGPGIPAECEERIFEPFFTTKEVGKGTGLGLSIIYGIIKEHRGSIRLETGTGPGAVFVFTLPATDLTA